MIMKSLSAAADPNPIQLLQYKQDLFLNTEMKLQHGSHYTTDLVSKFRIQEPNLISKIKTSRDDEEPQGIV